MFEIHLKKYNKYGVFSLKSFESLKDKCNAPTQQSGVYLIYKVVNNQEILIYIGSSGQRNKDGALKTRMGGMKDRLINGYHPNRFGQTKRIKRHIAFSTQMEVERIPELRFYWWVTYDDGNIDFPTDIESELVRIYCNKFGKLPDWHQQ